MTRTPTAAAPTTGAPAAAERVARALAGDATAFGFFQAVRLLGLLRPERAPVGYWADPADEVARFGASTTLGFPASELQSLDMADARVPARMVVHFLGLTGPQGVLPHLYTEHAIARTRVRDTAFRDFLDLFHHRFASLFYRAWAKHRSAVAHEAGSTDPLRDHLLDLAGFGTAGMRGRLPVADDALAFYAGLLAGRARPADGLANLVADYFGVAATIEAFVGAWCRIAAGGQCTLDAPDASGQLGFALLGDEAWDPQAAVRLRLGPLTRAQFDDFLPGGSAHEPLRALARLYADGEVAVEVQLVLAREAVTPCVLAVPAAPDLAGDATSRAAPGTAWGTALGRGSWLASRPMTRDPDETTLALC